MNLKDNVGEGRGVMQDAGEYNNQNGRLTHQFNAAMYLHRID